MKYLKRESLHLSTYAGAICSDDMNFLQYILRSLVELFCQENDLGIWWFRLVLIRKKRGRCGSSCYRRSDGWENADIEALTGCLKACQKSRKKELEDTEVSAKKRGCVNLKQQPISVKSLFFFQIIEAVQKKGRILRSLSFRAGFLEELIRLNSVPMIPAVSSFGLLLMV